MERMTDYKPQERQDLEELYRKQNVRIYELEQENKKLNEKYDGLWKIYTADVKEREEENKNLKEELSKLKEKYGDIDF